MKRENDTKPLINYQLVNTEQGVLFAKEKVENATLDGAKLKIWNGKHNYRAWPVSYAGHVRTLLMMQLTEM